MTLKLVFSDSLLDAQHYGCSVKNKPASLSYRYLLCCWERHFSAVAHPGGLVGQTPPLFKPNFCFKVKCPNCASAVRGCYFKTAVTDFAAYHAEAKSAGWCSGKRHYYPGGMWGMHPAHPPFLNMLLMNAVFHNVEPF